MKVVTFALLVAAIGALIYFKPWADKGASAPMSASEAADFVGACVAGAPKDLENPETFCRCLQREGVRAPTAYMATVTGRSAAAKCVEAPGL